MSSEDYLQSHYDRRIRQKLIEWMNKIRLPKLRVRRTNRSITFLPEQTSSSILLNYDITENLYSKIRKSLTKLAFQENKQIELDEAQVEKTFTNEILDQVLELVFESKKFNGQISWVGKNPILQISSLSTNPFVLKKGDIVGILYFRATTNMTQLWSGQKQSSFNRVNYLINKMSHDLNIFSYGYNPETDSGRLVYFDGSIERINFKEIDPSSGEPTSVLEKPKEPFFF